VIYLIVKTQPGLLAQGRLARTLLGATRDWIAQLSGVELEIHKGRPGLFNGERKVAAIGISIHNHVSMHGIAINLCNDLSAWRTIVPCGEPGVRPQTLSEAAGREFRPQDFINPMPEWLKQTWGYSDVALTASLDEMI
jgi:lipoyl synthase